MLGRAGWRAAARITRDGVLVGGSKPAAGAAASLVAISIGCGMVKNAEKMVFFPLPPAVAADRKIMPARFGIRSANR
jgi:hypothetical protein